MMARILTLLALTMAAPKGAAMESRLTDIEVKLSFTEDLVEELNRTVFRQQRQIDQLQQDLYALRQQIQSNLPPAGWSQQEEIPPHY
jgi:SlyX protein